MLVSEVAYLCRRFRSDWFPRTRRLTRLTRLTPRAAESDPRAYRALVTRIIPAANVLPVKLGALGLHAIGT